MLVRQEGAPERSESGGCALRRVGTGEEAVERRAGAADVGAERSELAQLDASGEEARSFGGSSARSPAVKRLGEVLAPLLESAPHPSKRA